ncbi:MAG: hypothetical protein IPP44_24950 [Ideonella sp.]|nr:hypothetical protein [Ideonella sp.]
MTYPDSAVPARQAFKIGNNTYVGGDATFLTFQKGEFRYVVFSGSGKGWTKEGVIVQKAGKQIADLRCNGSADTVLQTSEAPSKGFAVDSTPFELP